MNPRHDAVSERAQHRCEYCRAPERVFNFPLEVEHIVPFCADGNDEEPNLALACHSCNAHKAMQVSGIDPESKVRTRLFDPRRQRWQDHFRFNPASLQIEGLTPQGRATVVQLRMNSQAQIVARRLWVKMGVFP